MPLARGALALAVVLGALAWTGTASAARCTQTANGWSCTHQKRFNGYWCNGFPWTRAVRWQVPEGTPPSGGWPVAFYYAGTQLTDTSSAFKRNTGDPFGVEYEPQIIRELLDNPAGTGRKYAVIVADPPATSGAFQFWHTNVVFPYSLSCDYDFFPDFFGEIKNGSYGPASQYNMTKRYGYVVSSGGYNTSPTLPSNHPPTKFWHGDDGAHRRPPDHRGHARRHRHQGLVRPVLSATPPARTRRSAGGGSATSTSP